ncbi:ligase-associated DNA damage response DEXH box helicase [Amantichitinum ursilacus]|uniref:Putative ATP-dependent helicase Lhr n=1 Tax=Amantichitinum ursilacus TaxID=857265 RepID=A0A0N0XM08_9NEIS|nr:ligase-associated DNA damage response DEXH box helicase [Amantichitinum ursilacus]KPC54628.1 putative ATP-dependent helicase Lhr [Amantichitinum ursilacus]
MNAPASTSAFDPAAWFASRGWTPFPFQQATWQSIIAGDSGLLHASTGSGKTWAIWLAALARFGAKKIEPSPLKRTRMSAPKLTVIWITPMRALAADTAKALAEPIESAQLDWTLSLRTGDTSSSERAAQERRLPTALITTPESLTLMLSKATQQDALAGARMVVVDEWHELIGNKRGVQLQLALARLRKLNPALQIWGLSATLGNIDLARDVLLAGAPGRVVQGDIGKPLLIDTLLPPRLERFPWAGHLGIAMLPQVIDAIEDAGTTLVFLNTRSQAELWYQALLNARPDWAGLIAVHHGSLDREVRDWVEASLKAGTLKAVVCTSSLDLGVDFVPVERVLQIGSPKGVARALQRAGRSGHQPGRTSRLTMVPTHSMELVEAAAARHAIATGHLETRLPPNKPLDVLVQHLVTIALGTGFTPPELLAEVRTAWSYQALTAEEWEWALGFVRQGGSALTAYPEYRRVEPDEAGIWRVPDAALARRHRSNIGTIVSDASMVVQYMGGARLGTVEEGFIARLAPGDAFLFGGRMLELIRVHEMTALVRLAKKSKGAVPRWQGGRMSFSTELADAMVEQLELAAAGEFAGPEMQAVAPLLQVQQDWSAIPTRNTLLAEVWHSREGNHLFLYPFAGRHVHLGLASLLGWRVGQHQPATFSIAVNDYGFELLTSADVDWPALLTPELLSDEHLLEDVLHSLNAGELAQRRFREIARISGLVFQGHPGSGGGKSARQLQASSSLFYEVFRKHDPSNLLLTQAQTEVLRQELETTRLQDSLQRMQGQALNIQRVQRPTPLGFPLLIERFRESMSSEKLADRIARLVATLERAASGEADPSIDAHAAVMFMAPDMPKKQARSGGRRARPKRVFGHTRG